MRKLLLTTFSIAALSAGGFATAQEDRQSVTSAHEAVDGKQTLSYGSDPLQKLDFWHGTSASAPLVVFIHGGWWKHGDMSMVEGSAKLSHWRALGYAVASINYRLVPEATVEQQAADVAAALAQLRAQERRLGIDASRMAR